MAMSWREPSEELRKQLDESRRWLASSGREGSKVYLAYETQEGVDLAGASLVEGTLQEARMAGVRLDGADATRALANGVDLCGASLIGTDFDKAALVESDLSNAIATRVRLRKANLAGAKLDGADLRDADLSGASLLGASLRGSDLRGADLRTALLGQADLDGAKLDSKTQMARAAGIDEVAFQTLFVDGKVFEGEAGRAALRALARDN